MAKSNDKQNRTRGVMPSSNMELPNPLTNSNSPLANHNNNNKNTETIRQQNGQNGINQ